MDIGYGVADRSDLRVVVRGAEHRRGLRRFAREGLGLFGVVALAPVTRARDRAGADPESLPPAEVSREWWLERRAHGPR